MVADAPRTPVAGRKLEFRVQPELVRDCRGKPGTA